MLPILQVLVHFQLKPLDLINDQREKKERGNSLSQRPSPSWERRVPPYYLLQRHPLHGFLPQDPNSSVQGELMETIRLQENKIDQKAGICKGATVCNSAGASHAEDNLGKVAMKMRKTNMRPQVSSCLNNHTSQFPIAKALITLNYQWQTDKSSQPTSWEYVHLGGWEGQGWINVGSPSSTIWSSSKKK